MESVFHSSLMLAQGLTVSPATSHKTSQDTNSICFVLRKGQVCTGEVYLLVAYMLLLQLE